MIPDPVLLSFTMTIRSSLALLSLLSTIFRRSSTSRQPPPVHLTADQDHQRTLDLLRITSLRRGPDGDPKSSNAANFDESKVRPDPPGSAPPQQWPKGQLRQIWWTQRRPQIVEVFDREIYGRVPPNIPAVRWEVVSTTHEITGNPRPHQNTHRPRRQFLLPAHHRRHSALSLHSRQRHRARPRHHGIWLQPRNSRRHQRRFTPEQSAAFTHRPHLAAASPRERLGLRLIIPTSVQADNGAGLTEGIIGLVNKGQPRKLDDWGALRAWAWGASRALDYFETDRSVDAKQVGIEGLSRYGKAALVAMAYDQRFAIAFVGSSGEGGAKLLRRNFGEQVENIAATSEYHWMAGNFLKYAGPLTVNDLPVDAHELIALCAPRPVFISAGSQQVEGGWVDAKGMFLAAVDAGPVYTLLGKKDLATTDFPPIETTLIDGDIAFRQHAGGHTAGPNWPTFLPFASR